MQSLSQSAPVVNPQNQALFWSGFKLYAAAAPLEGCQSPVMRSGWRYGLRCEAAALGVRSTVLAAALGIGSEVFA